MTLLAEVSAGDPFDPIGPDRGVQVGALWPLGEHVALDAAVAVGAPAWSRETYEWIGRVGVSFSRALATPPDDA
jgi:hypothetical protein